MPVATLTSVPSVYPFLLTTLAPLAAAAASMLNERAMVTGWAVSPAFLITMSYSRESARMVTSHLYSRPSMPVSMFLKIMRSKDTFLARSSVGRCTYVRWATEKVLRSTHHYISYCPFFTWYEVSAKGGLGVGEHVDCVGVADDLDTVLVDP